VGIRARRLSVVVGTLLVAGTATSLMMRAQSAPAALTGPGALPDGSTVLSNGWRVSAAGRHVTVGDLPLNVVTSPDGRYLVVTNNGLEKPSFSVIDVGTWTVKQTVPLAHAWFGLVWHPNGKKLYSAGASQNNVQEFAYANGALTRARTFTLPSQNGDTFAGGVAISGDGGTLYVTRVFSMTVSAIDLASGLVVKTQPLPAEPYTCALSADGRMLFVSLWGGARVEVLDARTLDLIEEIATGEHPNALALSADGKRLFVACGGASSVWVFDTYGFSPIEQISVNLYPDAPPTATPNSLALSPDGQKLLVANADNNAVAVVDVSNASRSFVDGFIPTGAYPTDALFSRDGKQIFVLSGRGLLPAANPDSTGMESRLLGVASVLPTPDRVTLADYTRKVYSLTRYSDATRLSPANGPIGSPIPRTVGGSSPIKHVFYVVRENRTYDQVLGDLPQGNGDPTLVVFGPNVTPNAHALAQGFTLLDNFFVDADVSYNGHAYSMAAYANDFIQKMWQTAYGGRGGPYLNEGGWLLRNSFGDITAPAGGYIWDFCRRANVSVRSYGEFVRNATRTPAGEVTVVATAPGLTDAVSPAFAGFDLSISDGRRVDVWTQEFREYERNGNLPQLSILHLGNDHTNGTTPGALTPRAMMADNDLAIGRLVETISSSVYWKDSAVFIVEDDAQSGPDHVDSHRSVLLVASPFAKRTVADHTLYTTSSVLRTIELILGLPPMSQYDAAAAPLYGAFQSTPNLASYKRVQPLVSLTEKNPPAAYGSAMSLSMDFTDADRTPEVQLNEIIWRSVKGADSPMPPPRRSVFVRPANAAEGDDERDSSDN
jgi:YVTN family beta-propeller protein